MTVLNRRSTVTICSDYDALLINTWAEKTGQSTGRLLAALCESGLALAIEQGRIPQPIIDQVNQSLT